MPESPKPRVYSGNYKPFVQRFEPVEQFAVRTLAESCEKHGADGEKILESFAGIPLDVMENLSKEFENNPTRRSPNLDLMLFRDPGVVYRVYRAFAKHKFMLDRELTREEAGKKADQCVRDARAESAKYYKTFGQPELSKTKGEVQPVPGWAKLRLWRNGLTTDFANNAFVNEFLRTLKETHQYDLSDRLNVLFSLKPQGWFSKATFKDRIRKAFQTPADEISGQTVHDSLHSREKTIESMQLHKMMMESPEKVKFTYARVYQTFASRRPGYRLASFAESLARNIDAATGSRFRLGEKSTWKKKMDEQIDAHIVRTDSAIDQYHDTFHRDRQLRMDHVMRSST